MFLITKSLWITSLYPCPPTGKPLDPGSDKFRDWHVTQCWPSRPEKKSTGQILTPYPEEESQGKHPSPPSYTTLSDSYLDQLQPSCCQSEDGRAEKWKESGCFYISSGGCPICGLSVKQKEKLPYLNQVSQIFCYSELKVS